MEAQDQAIHPRHGRIDTGVFDYGNVFLVFIRPNIRRSILAVEAIEHAQAMTADEWTRHILDHGACASIVHSVRAFNLHQVESQFPLGLFR